MSLLHRTPLPRTLLRSHAAPLFATSPSSSSLHRQYATSKTPAQPKILNESPPSDEEAPQDVKDHNADLSQRADKANAQVKPEDVEKDKVPKEFWSGGQAGAKKDS